MCPRFQDLCLQVRWPRLTSPGIDEVDEVIPVRRTVKKIIKVKIIIFLQRFTVVEQLLRGVDWRCEFCDVRTTIINRAHTSLTRTS